MGAKQMKLQISWKEKMRFAATAEQHSFSMDTKPPIGADTAPSPKQLVLAAICGCTGMDVVSLLRKFKQPLESLEIEVDASLSEGSYPIVFKEVRLLFRVKGALAADKLLEAIQLSQTKYCSVSAMMSKATPINYTVELNSKPVGSGSASFT